MKQWMVALVVVGTILALIFLSALTIMVFWNWLMPPIFGLSMISYTQALALVVLYALLFAMGGLLVSALRARLRKD